MRKHILKGIAVLFILAFTACEKDKDTDTDTGEEQGSITEETFKGTWKNSDGTLLFTGGTNAITFKEVKGGRFQEALQKGLIRLGDSYIRNITKQGTSWKCDVLFWGIPASGLSVMWATNGTLSLSPDKKMLTISATSPFNATASSASLYKQ